MTDFAVGDRVRLKIHVEPIPEGAIGTIHSVDQSDLWPILAAFPPYHDRALLSYSEVEFVEEEGNDILDKELEALLDAHFGEDDDPDDWGDDEYPDFGESEEYLEALSNGNHFYNVFNTFFDRCLDEDPDDWDVRGSDFEGHDMVANPPHYQQYPFGEVIDITKHLGFLDGNVVKYVLRAPYKGSEIEDLKKAQQYLAWLIEKREEEA